MVSCICNKAKVTGFKSVFLYTLIILTSLYVYLSSTIPITCTNKQSVRNGKVMTIPRSVLQMLELYNTIYISEQASIYK